MRRSPAQPRGGWASSTAFPRRIRELFEQGNLPETPKPGDAVFAASSWRCLLDNTAALDVVEAKARAEGWLLERDLSVDDRPLEEAADTLIRRLRVLAERNPGRTVAVTTGGELSSPVTGGGQGGRNQAFVLCAARKLAALRFPAAVISAGTDGIDGNSPAAGALADRATAGARGRSGSRPRRLPAPLRFVPLLRAAGRRLDYRTHGQQRSRHAHARCLGGALTARRVGR